MHRHTHILCLQASRHLLYYSRCFWRLASHFLIPPLISAVTESHLERQHFLQSHRSLLSPQGNAARSRRQLTPWNNLNQWRMGFVDKYPSLPFYQQDRQIWETDTLCVFQRSGLLRASLGYSNNSAHTSFAFSVSLSSLPDLFFLGSLPK